MLKGHYTLSCGLVCGAMLYLLLGACTGAIAHSSAEPHGLGLEFASSQDFERYPHAMIARSLESLPSELLLTDYLPPAQDQGTTQSCVGWSTAYYCMSYAIGRNYLLNKEEVDDPKFEFSPSFIWDQYNGGNTGTGMHIYTAMDILSKQGCATLKDMPFDPLGRAKPSQEARDHAGRYKAQLIVNLFKGPKFGDPADAGKVRTWLWETQKPFVAGLLVFSDFRHVTHDPDFVYTPAKDARRLGGHAVCVVGYDMNKRAFRVINSWGPEWGNNGFLWISEDYFKRYAFEAWALDPRWPRARFVSGKTMKDITIVPAAKRHSTD